MTYRYNEIEPIAIMTYCYHDELSSRRIIIMAYCNHDVFFIMTYSAIMT